MRTGILRQHACMPVNMFSFLTKAERKPKSSNLSPPNMQRDRLPSPIFVLIVLWPHLIIDTITHLLPASFGVCELAFVTVPPSSPLFPEREVAFKKCSVLSGGPWPTSCGMTWRGLAMLRVETKCGLNHTLQHGTTKNVRPMTSDVPLTYWQGNGV